jgi:dihydrofolate synthase/folylpolyglutamate synthase
VSNAEAQITLDWLFAQKPRGRTYGIDRMRALADALGHPERATPCIHVAGTNGKGSVSAMLESIFRSAGCRVGLYTSPHLVSVGERVQVDRVPLGDAAVVEHLRELRPVAEALAHRDADFAPSFFEYMTAIAFREFARRQCDLAILEVGLGGRLDATNIVAPAASVITSIGLDHCELLGDTIEQIAAEKAGIIKARVPVVVGRVPPAARQVIAEIAAERDAPVTWVDEHFGPGRAPLPTTNLAGEYQRWNAATATLAARESCRSLLAGDSDSARTPSGIACKQAPTSEQIGAALHRVTWPGRWDRRRVGGQTLILDASHNPEGAETLEANLRELVAADGEKPIVVVGVLGAARARPLIEAIARYAGAIRLVVPNDPRACSYAELRALIPARFVGEVVDDSVERLFPAPGTTWLSSRAAAKDKSPTIVVTGSIYLVGEVMRRLA